MGVPVEAAQYYANLKKRRDVSQIAVLRIETTEPYSTMQTAPETLLRRYESPNPIVLTEGGESIRLDRIKRMGAFVDFSGERVDASGARGQNSDLLKTTFLVNQDRLDKIAGKRYELVQQQLPPDQRPGSERAH